MEYISRSTRWTNGRNAEIMTGKDNTHDEACADGECALQEGEEADEH